MRRSDWINRKIEILREVDRLKKDPRSGDSGRRGSQNEERAFSICLQLLKEESLIPLHHKYEPYLAQPMSLKDAQGYDIVIPTDKGDVGIQIKSSLKGLEAFMLEHPDIPCIVVNDYRSHERIKIELRAAILHMYDNL